MASQEALVVPEYLKSIDQLVVGKAPVPTEPAAHECLIEVAYSNIAFADILLVQGLYQNKPAVPFVPGTGFSGVVLKSGCTASAKGFKPGDRVFGFTISSILGYQKSTFYGPWQRFMLSAVDFDPPPGVTQPGEPSIPQLFHVPPSIPLISASCIPSALGTNYVALIERGRIKKGEVVVILAAAGGLGLTACQLAKAAGATVIALASTSAKLQLCKQEGGADHVINYVEDKEWDKTINAITKKMGKRWEGADIFYDPVGVPQQAARCLARKGRYLVIGFTARGAGGVGDGDKDKMPPIPSLQTNRMLLKSNEVIGVNWGSYFQHERENIHTHIPTALAMLTQAGFVPPVYEDPVSPHKQMAARPAKTPFKGLGSIRKSMEFLGTGKTWGLVAVEIAGEDAGKGKVKL